VALPAFVPDAVRVYLDRETGFPLRFLYLKKIPNRDVQRAMLTFDFLDVAINQPIDPNEFLYEPPTGVQPVELTNFFLDQLGEKK
jgi:outer membrane lipoprotein-sorting protein